MTYKIVGYFYLFIAVALIAAKLAGYIHWIWWLVLAPFWVPPALLVIVAIVGIALFSRASARGENPFI